MNIFLPSSGFCTPKSAGKWSCNLYYKDKVSLHTNYGVLLHKGFLINRKTFWMSLHFRKWHSFRCWTLGRLFLNSGRSTELKYSDITSSSPETIKSIRAIRRKKFSIENFTASAFSNSAFDCRYEINGSWKFILICFWYVFEMNFINEIGFYRNHWIIGSFNT